MKQDMSNRYIYEKVLCLKEAFADEVYYLPAKVNFYLQKNFSLFYSLFDEIELSRNNIIIHYGIKNDNSNDEYIIPNDKIAVANEELQELLNIEQSIEYVKIPLSLLGNVNFSNKQMQAILFMIEDDIEKKEE